VLELEVVNRALLDARDAVVERQSELVPVAKRATDVYLEENSQAYVRTAEDGYMLKPGHPGPDQARIDVADVKKKEFEGYLQDAEAVVDQVFRSTLHPCLGGKFVFVDLAGSEYYDDSSTGHKSNRQTPQERHESRQINADLFALKEVIRAGALNQARIPFRSSSLTMVLREHLLSESEDRSSSAMILTVSPYSEQFAVTMNTLKYGNLVGVAGDVKIAELAIGYWSLTIITWRPCVLYLFYRM
jgi:hypothetical protein